MKLIITLLLLTACAASAQNVIVVTNTNDEGPGSLRDAVALAESDSQSSTILFHESLAGDTIVLSTQLLLGIEDSTTIDGDIDDDGSPDVALVSETPGTGSCFGITSDHNTLEGLSISDFRQGVVSSGSANSNRLLHNELHDNQTAVAELGSSRLAISQNSIYSNSYGIRYSDIPAPVLITERSKVVAVSEPGYLIEYFLDAGTAIENDLFNIDQRFQGKEFVASGVAGQGGFHELDVTVLDFNGMELTATATSNDTVPATSRFSLEANQTEAAGNNWSMLVSNHGSWGMDVVPINPGGEFPAGSGNILIFAGGLYIGGLKDPNASDPFYRYSVSNYEFHREYSDFSPGIVVTDESISVLKPRFRVGSPVHVIDETRSGVFYDFWAVEKGAPLDAVGNPMLVSDLDSWTVFSDVDTAAHDMEDSPNPVLGLEVQQMTYQFNASTLPGAENTVFVRWRIQNKSQTNYDSLYFAVWSDPDVGIASNDLPGTDTVRNMFYVYNYDDEITSTSKQYVVGYKLLYATLNGGSSARLRATVPLISSCHPQVRDPQFDYHRYFFMQGLDQDGTLKLASEGYVENDGDRLVFPGDPITGQGLLAASNLCLAGGTDIRMIASVGPFSFESVQVQDVVFAIIGGEGTTRNDAILDLRAEADQVADLFESDILPRLNTDAVAPVLSLGLIQNPESSLKDRVSLYLNADEPLSFAGLEVSQNGSAQEKNLTYLEHSDNVWFTDLILDQTGFLSLTLEARDLAGNLATIDRSYTVFRTGGVASNVAGKGGSKTRPSQASGTVRATVVSPDGKLTLSLGPDEGPATFGLLGAEDIPVATDSRVRPWALGATYRVGPDGVATNSILSFQYEPDDRVIDPSRLGIYRYANGSWQYVGGILRSGAVSAEITVFGRYGLFYDDGDLVPTDFSLDQNYPNPFNPVTTIRYQLPEDSKVTLTVYNVLGQKVRTLVDAKQNAGIYSARWDGKNDFGVNVASGVYVYRIVAGNFVKVRKMLMVR